MKHSDVPAEVPEPSDVPREVVEYTNGPRQPETSSVRSSLAERAERGRALFRRLMDVGRRFGDANETQEQQVGEEEFDIDYLKIPNGHSSDERWRYWLDEKNEPTREELAEFYAEHPDALDRIVICREVPIDLLDENEMFGNEPGGGYLHIVGKEYEGKERFADEFVLKTLVNNKVKTGTGREVPVMGSYHEWPKDKYPVQVITPRRTPNTYAAIRELLGPEVEVPPTNTGRMAIEGTVVPPEQPRHDEQ